MDETRRAKINEDWKCLVEKGWEIDVGSSALPWIDQKLWSGPQQPPEESRYKQFRPRALGAPAQIQDQVTNDIPRGPTDFPRYELLNRPLTQTILRRKDSAKRLPNTAKAPTFVIEKRVTNNFQLVPVA